MVLKCLKLHASLKGEIRNAYKKLVFQLAEKSEKPEKTKFGGTTPTKSYFKHHSDRLRDQLFLGSHSRECVSRPRPSMHALSRNQLSPIHLVYLRRYCWLAYSKNNQANTRNRDDLAPSYVLECYQLANDELARMTHFSSLLTVRGKKLSIFFRKACVTRIYHK